MNTKKKNFKSYVAIETFLFNNDKIFYTGAEIKDEIISVVEGTKDKENRVKEYQIASYMYKKFVDTNSPLSDQSKYQINVNRLVFNIPYDEFLMVNFNSHVKIIRNRKVRYQNLKVTENKFFLDFLKYLRNRGIELTDFALIQYNSGEKRLVSSNEEFSRWIYIIDELEGVFGVTDYVDNLSLKDVSDVLMSREYHYMRELNLLEERGVNIRIYDKTKRYKY